MGSIPTLELEEILTLSFQFKLHVLTLSGDLLTSFSPFPNPGFGIRNVAWHPTGVFLALGGWDEKVDGWFLLSP